MVGLEESFTDWAILPDIKLWSKLYQTSTSRVSFIALPILYRLMQLQLSKGGLTLDIVSNVTQTQLINIFKIEKQDIIGYLIGIATIPVLGVFIVAALKRTFEKKVQTLV